MVQYSAIRSHSSLVQNSAMPIHLYSTQYFPFCSVGSFGCLTHSVELGTISMETGKLKEMVLHLILLEFEVQSSFSKLLGYLFIPRISSFRTI